MPPPTQYRGRFASSPTGPLHFGSLIATVGSYLDAKHHQGKWLVRIEDLDTPRTFNGAAEEILSTLEAYGLHRDADIIYQSQRTAAYEDVFRQLNEIGAVYPCACTRKEIADSALQHGDELVYPGTCRNGLPSGKTARAWRVCTDHDSSRHSRAGGNPAIQNAFCSNPLDSRLRGNDETQNENGMVEFNDALQNHITQHLENEIGAFVVKRADGLFAYQLAVVVDDAAQGITDVVRGAELTCSTPPRTRFICNDCWGCPPQPTCTCRLR